MTDIIKKTAAVELAGTQYSGIKAREIEEKEIKKALYDQIKIGYKISQTKLPLDFQKEITATVEMVYPEIVERHGGLTEKEIRLALRNGFYGRYGDFYGITPKEILRFIDAYSVSDQRKSLIKQSRDAQEASQKPQPPKKLTDDQRKEWWAIARERFKDGHEVIAADHLWKIGLDYKFIRIDDAELKSIKEAVTEQFRKEKASLLDPRRVMKLKDRKKIEELKLILETHIDQRGKYKKWVLACKREAVIRAFESEIKQK